MNPEDNQEPNTSGDDREWLEEELAELQAEGSAKKRISSVQKEEMLRIQGEVGYSSVIDLLSEHFPNLLTAQGKKEKHEEEREYREIQRTGEYAPPIIIEGVGPRPDTEPPATAKQIAYLRDLGVTDEVLLSRLGKRQASAVIEKALETRDKAFSQPQNSGCFGVLACTLLVGCILWILCR